MNHTNLRAWLYERIAECAEVEPGALRGDIPFADLGIGSADALDIIEDLRAELGLDLEATALWNYPTIEALLAYLSATA